MHTTSAANWGCTSSRRLCLGVGAEERTKATITANLCSLQFFFVLQFNSTISSSAHCKTLLIVVRIRHCSANVNCCDHAISPTYWPDTYTTEFGGLPTGDFQYLVACMGNCFASDSNHLCSLAKPWTLLCSNKCPLSFRCRWMAEACSKELALLCCVCAVVV